MCCKQFITHIILVAAEGLWHRGSLFYHSTQYSQRGCFTNLLWCDILWNKAPCTGPCHIWHTYTQMAVQLGWEFRWPVFVMGLLCFETYFAPTLGLSTNLGVWQYWLFPASSVKFLTRSSLKSRWVYLAPHEGNSIQLLSALRSRGWKTNLWSTWRYVNSRNSC